MLKLSLKRDKNELCIKSHNKSAVRKSSKTMVTTIIVSSLCDYESHSAWWIWRKAERVSSLSISLTIVFTVLKILNIVKQTYLLLWKIGKGSLVYIIWHWYNWIMICNYYLKNKVFYGRKQWLHEFKEFAMTCLLSNFVPSHTTVLTKITHTSKTDINSVLCCSWYTKIFIIDSCLDVITSWQGGRESRAKLNLISRWRYNMTSTFFGNA